MKGILSCALLFLTGFAFSQTKALEKAIDIHFQNLTLEECLGLLGQDPNIQLSYSSDWLPKDRQFTYQFKAVPVNTILNILLRDTELSYAEAGAYIAIRPTPGEVPPPLRYTISGVVEDAQSGERLTGVNIYQPNTGRGTTTNENGFFSLSLPADSVDLIFSYVGYSPLEQSIGLFENQQLLIPLQPSTTLSTIEVKANAAPPSLPPLEGSNQQPRISGALIEEMPAILGEGDALQALDLLPGVQAGSASLGSVNVRGGDNGHNLFLLDGAQVYNPNHLLGVYSVFNSSAVKDVELIKGALPAQYGGRLSSVITVNGKEGNFNEFKAEGSIGLIAAKVMIEGPVKKGKSSFLLSGRRSIWDWLAKPIINAADTRLDIGYHFGDLNFKYKHKISERDDWSFSLYLGEDRFKYYEDFADHPFDTLVISQDSIRVVESKDINDIRVGWSNKLGALNWNHVWNDRLFSNASLSYSTYRFDLFVEIVQKGFEGFDTTYIDRFSKAVYYSGINDLSLRWDFDWNWKQNVRLRYGGRLIWHHYQPQSSGNGLLILADDRVGNAIPGGVDLKFDPLSLHAFEKGFYGEATWDINRRWQLFAGAHLAGFNYGKDWFFSFQPRLRTNYELPGSQRIFGSIINVQQYAHLLTNNNFNLPTDIWVPANAKIGPESSWQFGLGWEKKWGVKKYQVSLEAYYNHLENLVTFSPYSSTFRENNWEENLVQGKGRSYGLEFLLRKNAGILTGLLSYHLSWAERQFPGFNNNTYFPHRNNRRHQLAAMANIALGPKTKFNMAWHFSTGNHITISDQRIPVAYNDNGSWSYDVYRDYSTVNNAQMPNYHRLDINFTFLKKRKTYERKWSVGFFNVYNRLNPTLYTEYVDTQGNRSIEAVTIFTIIPSVSYQLKF